MFNPTPQSRAAKIGYLLLTGMMREISVLLQVATAFILVIEIASDADHIRASQFIFIGSVGVIRGLAVFFSVFLAIGAPSHRMVLGTTPESQPTWSRIFARIWHGLAILYAAAAFCVTVIRLVLDIPDVSRSSPGR